VFGRLSETYGAAKSVPTRLEYGAGAVLDALESPREEALR
jgi:hypothetical protein